jgi:hypothetical protein
MLRAMGHGFPFRHFGGWMRRSKARVVASPSPRAFGGPLSALTWPHSSHRLDPPMRPPRPVRVCPQSRIIPDSLIATIVRRGLIRYPRENWERAGVAASGGVLVGARV